MKLVDLRPREEREAYAAIFSSPAESQEPQFSGSRLSRHVTKDGEVLNVEVFAHSAVVDDKKALIAVVQDLTEKVATEEAVRIREAQYREMFEAQADAVLIVGKDGVIADVNPAACEMYGYECEELRGKTVLELIGPEYQHVFVEARDAMEKGLTYSAQSCDVRKDGSRFHTNVLIRGFLYGGTPHALVVVRDIEELKETETNLIRALKDLKARNEELEAFVYTAAHDLRTPLVSVIGFTDLLKEEIEGKLDREQKYMLGRVSSNARHFDILLKDLLSFAQSGIPGA
jgi:PAS domain S-box-containing protein